MTTRDQLARVQGMRGLAIRFASVVGGPLGGLAVAIGGAAAAFGLAGLLIAVSVPLLISVRMRELAVDDQAEAAGGSVDAGDAGEDAGGRSGAPGAVGLRAPTPQRAAPPPPPPERPPPARPHPWGPPGRSPLHPGPPRPRPLMLAIALGDLGFVGPLNVGLTLLADERGWGASGMGWVLSGFGVGAGAAALLLIVRGRLPHAGHVAGWAILAGSVAIGALAFVPGVLAAVGVALLVGLLAGLSGALCGALLQTQADPAYLGRVTAVSSLVSLGFAPLSMPLSAAAIEAWGTGPVFVGSAAVCGLGGVVALCVRDLRRAELPG